MHIRFRLAKVEDSGKLAKIHICCGENQSGAYMHKLGTYFLKEYYRIVIKNPHSIVLLAEDENGKCLGFHSGTMRAEEHFESLKKNRFKLFIALIPKLISKPFLILSVVKRYASIAVNDSKFEFGVKVGPRGEYWAWLPSYPNPVESLNLHKKWHIIMKTLGMKYVRSEVDLVNDRIYKSIKLMGGIIIDELTLFDGRKRAIVQYDLTKY